MPSKSLALAVTAASEQLFQVPVLPQQPPAFLAPAYPPPVAQQMGPVANLPAAPVGEWDMSQFEPVRPVGEWDMNQFEPVVEEDAPSWSGFGATLAAAALSLVALGNLLRAGRSPVAEELTASLADHEMNAVAATQRKLSMLAVDGAAKALDKKPANGRDNGVRMAVEAPPPTTKQDFLEAVPHWDQSTIPVNTYKAKEPFPAKVVSVERIVGPEAIGETCHIILQHDGKMPYYEGQSYGVVPPGTNPKNGKPHGVRLYSIASSRYGDDMTGNTASLVVKRATYWCPEKQAEDPAKKGVCSNYLCDLKAGDTVMMTGPSGKVMLMPEENPNMDYIMIATGTGIAPYRGMIRRLFTEKTPAGEAYKGLAWLFLGVMNEDSILYKEEWDEVKKNHPDNFRVDYALSQAQKTPEGGSMYIQHRVAEYGEEVYDRMEKGAILYICGLKGVVAGMNDMFGEVCEKRGTVWEDKLKEWKKNGQWRVEVY
jgi:ferredoxin--NADP+ reductase